MLATLTKFSSLLFFIFALFPFVSFGLNSMDTQPFYILIASATLFLYLAQNTVFYKTIYLLLILFLIIFTLTLLTKNMDFMYFRAIASYTGFFVGLIVSIISFMKYGIPKKLIINSNIIYLIVAIIQAFSGSNKNEIFDFLVVSNTFASPTRGVIGLTPEPTIFAVLLFFFSWVILLMDDYKPSKKNVYLILANVLAILVLARSSMGFVFLSVAALFYLIGNLNKKIILFQFIAILFCATIYIFLMQYLFPESRFVNLSKILFALDGNFLSRLIVIINFDASINDRVLNAVFPYIGLLKNHGLPGGIDSFYDMSKSLVESTNNYFWSGLGSNKILSFVGAFIYELGFLGIICVIYFYYFLRDKTNSNRFLELILLFVLLNSSIPVALPIIPILMALMYYKKINNEEY